MQTINQKQNRQITETSCKHGNTSGCCWPTHVNIRRRVKIEFQDPSLAQQQLKEEMDINNIINKYKVTGILPNGIRDPFYGDVSNIPDYQTALNIVNDAQASFMSLPSNIRSRFNNNPQELLNFLGNAENEQEAVALGLIPAQGTEGSKTHETASKGQSRPNGGDSKKPSSVKKPSPEGAAGGE